MSGLDSATAPTLDQAKAAIDAKYSWWAFYIGYQGVPGNWACYHQWTVAEVDVLFAAGFELFLPIFFPRMDANGRISARSNPESDADLAVWSAGANYGVKGVVALDTEETMRGYAWTYAYEKRWVNRVRHNGWEPVTYAGGFTYGSPPTGIPWWIVPGGRAPVVAGQAWQTGQTTIDGLHVDEDHIGNGFPLATRTRRAA